MENRSDVSAERIHIVYAGKPVEHGTMDVRDLAPSLLSISELCQEVNRQLHGADAAISVRVRADFKHGSFGVDLEVVKTFLDHVRTLLNDPKSETVSTVVEAIFGTGGIIALLKWLKGEDEPNATTLENGNTKITVKGKKNHIEVNTNVYQLSKNPKVRKHVDGAVRPLQKEGMNQISVKQGKKTLQTVKRKEMPYLLDKAPEETFEQQQNNEHVVIRQAYLEIVKLSFRVDNKWSFGDGAGGSLQAGIEDHDFLKRVARHEYAFGKGDQLKVMLKTTTHKMPGGKYQSEHVITQVLEFIQSPQADLFK